jgi:hypothetical protein
MARYAILIHAENADELHPLRGPRIDVRNLTAYLESPLGGGWRRNEIEALSHPSIEDVMTRIDMANHSEYCFFFFSGHGGYYGREMSIQLSFGHAMMIPDVLRRIQTRCTLIVDACRSIVREDVNLEIPHIDQVLREGVDRLDAYRDAFDRGLNESTQPKTVLYSCRRNQESVDTPTGALFISNLIAQANEWSALQQGARLRLLNCMQALARAKERIALTAFDQTPVLDPISGLGGQPPFAVWLPHN